MYTAPPGSREVQQEEYAAWSQPIGPIVHFAEAENGEVAPVPRSCVLKGTYVDLVPVTAEHIANDLWFNVAAGRPEDPDADSNPIDGAEHPNDRLWTYMLEGPYTSRKAWIESQQKLMWHSDMTCFAIVPKVDPRTLKPLTPSEAGQALGRLALFRLDAVNRSVEVGHVIFSKKLQRSPCSTEPLALLGKYVFETLGYRRFEWKCHSLNAPSMSAAERFGFTFEGIFRKLIVMKGRNRDTAWWSIIDDDWRGYLAETYKEWFQPDNFDDQGRQKKTLTEIRNRRKAAWTASTQAS